jgi:hypothetical protein
MLGDGFFDNTRCTDEVLSRTVHVLPVAVLQHLVEESHRPAKVSE